ncbi:hypothetical protein Tco_1459814, partial [Tanacetum coccineum]
MKYNFFPTIYNNNHLIYLRSLISFHTSKYNGIFEFEFTKERVASVATNARQSKGKLHDIFLATSFISPGLMLLNLDQLEKQLGKEEFQETKSMDAFRALKTQFQL